MPAALLEDALADPTVLNRTLLPLFTTTPPLLSGSKVGGVTVFILGTALGLYSMSTEHSLNALSRLKRGIEVQSVD